MGIRTDLALEEREFLQQKNGTQTELAGVSVRERERRGIHVTTVKILDERGAEQLHKPIGTYLTLEIDALCRREQAAFDRTVQALAQELRAMVDGYEQVLIIGLGNEAITPDAIGPLSLKNIIVTRHLRAVLPSFRCVSAFGPGVLGTTGMESAQIVRALAQDLRPDLIVVIDALASSDKSRLCRTIQLTDTGIVPGSGVGNSRAAFNESTLGAPVIAIGVPTVMDADEGMMITPRDIDAKVPELGKLIGYGLNLALHRGLNMEDVSYFLS